MKKTLRAFSVAIGMLTLIGAAMVTATTANAATAPAHASAQSAHVISASAASAVLTAAHPSQTVMLSVSRSAKTVTLKAESGQAPPLVLTVRTSTITPKGVNCYFPTCGWEFSHAQTVGLWTGSFAAALAACHHYLGAVGLTYVCDAVAGWLATHIAPQAHQCLYVSTLPVGVIKYVSC
jgi:hypothetical protein